MVCRSRLTTKWPNTGVINMLKLCQPEVTEDNIGRLVDAINQTNLVALDKGLLTIKSSHKSYAASAARLGNLGERMVKAVKQVSLTLPRELR